MRFGAHLPLVDFDGRGWQRGQLASYVEAARRLGYECIGANDHFVFEKPWLDSVVALASVIDRSGSMQLVTTIALPVVRGPAAVAKAAAALDVLSGGRFVLGVGPGSSARDYESAGVRFDERWPRLDESIRVLRTHLRDGAPIVDGRFYATPTRFEPSPVREGGVPIWIGSWGSDAGLRRVARLGNGWIASAYNTTPARLGEARSMLGDALAREGRSLAGFPCALTTMWTYVTDDDRTRRAHLQALERMLNRPGASLERQLLVGPAEVCAAVVREYAEAGVDRLFVWPLADCETQLDRFMTEVVPLV